MANLVSPGVSVTVTNESFFVPAAAGTIPLIFLATAAEKLQPNGEPAMGTHESGTVRLVTSEQQASTLYGTPVFREDSDGNQLHGDARNEYGLFALNKFLGISSRAYTVRANVNLNDNRDDIADMWEEKTLQSSVPFGAAYLFEIKVNDFLETYNAENGLISSDPNYKITITESEFLDLFDEALTDVFGKQVEGLDVYFQSGTFKTTRPDLFGDHRSNPLSVFANGYNQPSTGQFIGIEGETAEWVSNQSGSVVNDQWTATEAKDLAIDIFTDYQYTVSFLNNTSLGATDSARRQSIVEALQEQIVNNQEIRSKSIEYSLVVCPGYYEVVDNLISLQAELNNEVFAIGETPMDMSPNEIVNWASTNDRARSEYLAYYYPHGLGANTDGTEVLGGSAALALRTIAYNDQVADLWFAPAGTRRGRVTGFSRVGYVGRNNSFVNVQLNDGQVASLYEYQTNINPIVFFPNQGLLVWGQKTSATAASALDRINVSRLIAFIARQLRKASMPFIFQPNDQLTRDNWKGVADNFLSGLMNNRALYDFATVSDDTNNTPAVIDRNEMYLDVALKPTKAAEFLYVPIRVLGTGDEL